jgi:hypothetical protein
VIALGLAAALTAVALGLAGYLWLYNTRELSIVHVIDEPVAPGDTITVPRPDDGELCGPGYERLYRAAFGGRWRQTHSGSSEWTRDERSLWAWPRSRQEFSELPCPIGGPVHLTIPEDVTWSPVVACEVGGTRCVRLPIDIG